MWRAALSGHPEATPAALDSMRANLYTTDFVYTVTRDFVRTVQTPLLMLPGSDDVHPFAIGEELARLAPHSEMIAEWKAGAALESALTRIRAFLQTHVPAPAATR